MELDRDLLARRLLDGDDDQEVEQRLRVDPEAAVATRGLVDGREGRRRRRPIDLLDLEARPIGDDRLHRDDSREPRRSDERRAVGVEEPVEGRRLEDQPLDQRLEPDDLADLARDDRRGARRG